MNGSYLNTKEGVVKGMELGKDGFYRINSFCLCYQFIGISDSDQSVLRFDLVVFDIFSYHTSLNSKEKARI